MRVRKHTIPPLGGLDVDFEIGPRTMQESMASEDEVEEMFPRPVSCHLHLDLVDHRDVALRGAATTLLNPTCARCGEPFDFPMEVEANLTCSPQNGVPSGTDSYQESRDGLVYFRQEELALTPKAVALLE